MIDFWNTVYNQEHNDLSTDMIFDKFDTLLSQQKSNEANDLLKVVDVDSLNTFTMRSILVITFAYADELSYRETLFDRIYNKALEIIGKEKTEKIIGKLR